MVSYNKSRYVQVGPLCLLGPSAGPTLQVSSPSVLSLMSPTVKHIVKIRIFVYGPGGFHQVGF